MHPKNNGSNLSTTDCIGSSPSRIGGKMGKGKIRKIHYEILRHQEKVYWKPS
jgi:hypothetical protein